MSDSEHSTSDSSSEKGHASSNSDGDDTGVNFMFRSDFAPYQNEPLAANNVMAANDNVSSDEEGDEDGILPSVLEQRFEGQVPVNEW